jgi:hypothetical protein
MKHTRPEDIFRAEKERAVSARNSQHARLLAEAKAAFDKLMAEGQAARKSGRPRKHPLPPLKTTSSRTPPPRPPFEIAPAPVVAKPMVPAPAPAPAPKPAPVKAAAKPVAAKKTKPASRPAAKGGKAKPKAKPKKR